MAIYSCNISNIKRSDGRSSVAKAAYNSRSELLDERTGNKYNYSNKTDLGFSEIIAPLDAPSWANDRQQLWSKNELANLRRDARVAKEILVALPRELDSYQQLSLVRSFVSNNLTPLSVVADVNAHELEPSLEPDWNPHVHILITTQLIVDGEFGSKITELNKKEFVTSLREAWAEETNKALAAAGISARVDHRSNKARGIDRIPQIHLGHKAWAMKQKGIATDRGDRFVEIQQRNQEIDSIAAEVAEAIAQSKIKQEKQLREPKIASVEEKPKKPWWKVAAAKVFGKRISAKLNGATNQAENLIKPGSSRKDLPNSSPQIAESNPTQEQKQEVALALATQLKNHRQINALLRTVPGKLVLLTSSKQAIVLARKSGFDLYQQSKLIIERDLTGWKITKYQLTQQQRFTLLKVLKKIEQQPDMINYVGGHSLQQTRHTNHQSRKSR